MKTFTDIKKRFVLGQSLTMLEHSSPLAGGLVGIPRKIKTVQSNAIQFEPHVEGKQGSWLQYPKASAVTILDNDSFKIDFGFGYMTYKFD
jgi:hypothetical protein